jgi:hypothetical protein
MQEVPGLNRLVIDYPDRSIFAVLLCSAELHVFRQATHLPTTAVYSLQQVRRPYQGGVPLGFKFREQLSVYFLDKT